MYDLAAYPHHVAELRQEVETVISQEGLSKDSLEKMYKLDSFIKETLRLHGPVEGSFVDLYNFSRNNILLSNVVSSRRKVLKDFTLSNGMVIPAGNTLAFAGIAMHRDDVSRRLYLLPRTENINIRHAKEYFQNPEQFDGFRFAKLREAEDDQVKYQTVALGREYVTFGVGRHAW
jgi:cytochrome P450